MNRRYSNIFLVLVTVIGLLGCQQAHEDKELKDYYTLNPSKDFVLTNQDGQVFHLSQLRGKTVFLFFGFLSCPDICPTALSKLTRVYKQLPEINDHFITVFVSVDPAKDTPAKLKEYLSFFKIKSIGLTGAKEEIDKVVDAYGAVYQIVPQFGGDYTIDHSAYIYLIDKLGKVRQLFHPEDGADKIIKAVKELEKEQ